jgi:hypothetical protein
LYAQTLEIFEAYKVYHRLSRIRLKYGELVTPRTGLMPFSDRPDSDANHRNLENWWSAEFSAAWAYTPPVSASDAATPATLVTGRLAAPYLDGTCTRWIAPAFLAHRGMTP